MFYNVLYKCTPSVAQHTLRGIATAIEEYEKLGYELVDMNVTKDLTSEIGLLEIVLKFKSITEIKMENLM